MAYFDDPAHKAQWERELAALREERQRRIDSSAAKHSAPSQENTAKLPAFEELVRQAAERYENKGMRRSAESPAVPQKKRHQEAASRGNVRERITFAQLLAEDENRRSAAPAASAKNKHITMEAGNAL